MIKPQKAKLKKKIKAQFPANQVFKDKIEKIKKEKKMTLAHSSQLAKSMT